MNAGEIGRHIARGKPVDLRARVFGLPLTARIDVAGGTAQVTVGGDTSARVLVVRGLLQRLAGTGLPAVRGVEVLGVDLVE